MNVTTFVDFRAESRKKANPAEPGAVVMTPAAHRPNALFLRVLNGPTESTPASKGLRVYDRMHFFTGRLGHFSLQTSPVLGNGSRLSEP